MSLLHCLTVFSFICTSIYCTSIYSVFTKDIFQEDSRTLAKAINEPWTIRDDDEILTVTSKQEKIRITHKVRIEEQRINDGVLKVFLTDVYFMKKGVLCFVKARQLANKANESIEDDVFDRFGPKYDCKNTISDSIRLICCSFFTESTKVECRFRRVKDVIYVTYILEGWSPTLSSHVWSVIESFHEDTNSDEILDMQRYIVNLVETFSLPIIFRKDDFSQAYSDMVIASVANMDLLSPEEIVDRCPGFMPQTICFKDRSRIPRNASNYPIITYELNQRGQNLEVMMLFKLMHLEQGKYQCLWKVRDRCQKVLRRMYTNKMVCCSDEHLHGYIEYFEYLASNFIWSQMKITYTSSEFWMLNSTLVALFMEKVAALDYIKKSVLIYKMSCLAAILLVLISFTGVIIVFVCRCVERKTEQKRRERLHHLEVLVQLESVPNSHKDLLYDVFLSYSSQDRDFIEDVVLEGLESRGYKCCYDPRDFQIGKPVTQNIVEGINNSRKTLAVFSKDYLSSYWCIKFEFMLTFLRIIQKSGPSDSLVILMYKSCSLDQIFKKKNFINWTDYNKDNRERFWKDIMKCLGPPKCKKNLELGY